MQIKLENLKKTYKTKDGFIEAVNDISLNIPDNTIFGIIGKSGAGKSSLVRLISLLEKPDSGAVYYNEERVDNLSKKSLIQRRRKIGMIFQNFNLFTSRTAARNVAYPLEICGRPKDEIEQRVKEMLSLVGLADRANAPISTLSGGQKQRIAIARALATNPDILFCDEATSALDPQTTRSILDLIREIQKKMNLTVVMITHQMEVVRDACEYVAVIENGKVVEENTVSQIFTNPQTQTTKAFIKNIVQNQGDDSNEGLLRWSQEGGKYILRFINEATSRPVISSLCKKFNVDINIRAGGIQHLPNEDIGSMIVDIMGPEEEVQKAISFLKEEGIEIEEDK
ncbi:MAG: methionine ABC transporter ATP-binding protein [Treponema sp.]|nr:methionine ABC transporter ATP-binding protein [Treponema sp.]